MCFRNHLKQEATFSKIKLVFCPIHWIQEPLEFCEYLYTFIRYVGETIKQIMKIKYPEAKQKTSLYVATQPQM